ncbi:MAG: transmembrane sensor [Zhongshania aliphaticivorans]|jgi:transmembrane sensor
MSMNSDQSLSQTEQDKIYHWLIHGGRDLACTEERASFEHWLAEKPARKDKAESVKRLWCDPDFIKAVQLTNASSHGRLATVWARASRHSVAASILVMCGLGLFTITPWFAERGNSPSMTSTYRTQAAETTSNTLNDGSTVNLSGDTEVAVNFNERARELKLLRGEAMFDVAKDSQRPFIVQSQNLAVTAVGTAFNVDQRGKITELTVLEGIVKVALVDHPEQTRMVSAGQQLVASAKALGASRTIDLLHYDDWRLGRIRVDDMPLEELLIELNRYSDIRLMSQDRSTARKRVSGSFALRDSETNIEILATLHQLNVTRQGNAVMFSVK